ncbi:MAG: 50S ribosomal protein L10 [Chitinophagales bacterium]
MTKKNKSAVIELLKAKFEELPFFYVADSSTLSVEEVNNLRRLCFERGIEMKVAKNTLIRKALEQVGDNEKQYEGLYDALKGPTALFFSDVSNLPAKVIQEFRKTSERPILKGAYIDSSIFMGDDSLDALSKLKSKDELLGEIIGLLQSPAKNVIGALQSGGQKLMGILETLSEKEG